MRESHPSASWSWEHAWQPVHAHTNKHNSKGTGQDQCVSNKQHCTLRGTSAQYVMQAQLSFNLVQSTTQT